MTGCPIIERRIAVVGGGISGLSAALWLIELLPDAQLDLFEAANRLGGVLQTVRQNGFLIEHAADNFLVKPPAAIELCQQLGMADQLLTTDESRRRAFVVRSGKLVPVPDGFFLMSPRKFWPLVTTPTLSIAGKLRLLAEPLIPRSKTGGDESVASFTQRRLGREVLEQLVQPLVAGIYTADPAQLSMAATMPQFLEYERRFGSLLRATLRSSPETRGGRPDGGDPDSGSGARYGLFVAPKDGMSSLVSALAKHLSHVRIHVNSPVASLMPVDGRWRLEPQSPVGADRLPPFDAVVVAIPAHAAAKTLEPVDVVLAEELADIEYSGCAIVCCGYERRQIGNLPDGFGFVVPQSERRRILAVSFASSKFPGRAPERSVLMRVFLGGALQPEMLKLSNAELIRVARDELGELLRIAGDPVVTEVVRWPQSMPQYHVGHLDRIARIEQRVSAYPTLALAGNAYSGVGIPHCVASGRAAAERIATGLEITERRR